jgi:enamine deaminase RidA (YjgF/YER057c/UK114 family)
LSDIDAEASVARVSSGSPFESIAGYCRAIRVGSLVAVSGTAALDDAGITMHSGDVYRQTKTCFSRALEAAAKLDAHLEDVVRTRVFLAPGTNWQEAVRAHGELFGATPPANTTLFVAGFIPEGVLVEVELEAVVRS